MGEGEVQSLYVLTSILVHYEHVIYRSLPSQLENMSLFYVCLLATSERSSFQLFTIYPMIARSMRMRYLIPSFPHHFSSTPPRSSCSHAQ